MDMSSFCGLEGLTNVSLRSGLDMRPTLLRVLTDLYVQKLTHTPDEERHYTELALRLLDSVDAQTRAAVAARLARHLAPPAKVIEKLSRDLPDVAAALSPPPSRNVPVAREGRREVLAAARPEPLWREAEQTNAPDVISAEVAGELNELFFAANSDERRLILLNLHVVASLPRTPARVGHDPTIGPRLEAAALARKREEFARQIANALSISREQAHRIATDALGEPIVIAAKALSISRELLYRILLFVNTAVGHSVERVHTLARLYDEIPVQAVEDFVAMWQALAGSSERARAAHRPLIPNDAQGVRPAGAVQRAPIENQGRRQAS